MRWCKCSVWKVINIQRILTVVLETPHIKNWVNSPTLTIKLLPFRNFLLNLHHDHVLSQKLKFSVVLTHQSLRPVDALKGLSDLSPSSPSATSAEVWNSSEFLSWPVCTFSSISPPSLWPSELPYWRTDWRTRCYALLKCSVVALKAPGTEPGLLLFQPQVPPVASRPPAMALTPTATALSSLGSSAGLWAPSLLSPTRQTTGLFHSHDASFFLARREGITDDRIYICLPPHGPDCVFPVVSNRIWLVSFQSTSTGLIHRDCACFDI